MATTIQSIKNGQVIAAPTGEKELRRVKTVPKGRTIGFLVTSGTMQVTVGEKDADDVIDAQIHAFGNTVNPVWMTIEDGGSGDDNEKNLFIKGSGTIVLFW